LARDLVTGDGSSSRLVIPLRYSPMRVPETPATVARDAANRPGADFAQIYFPAQGATPVGQAYSAQTTSDPWQRPSRYPPLEHRIFSATLSRLPYGWGCLVHLAAQVLLMLASLLLALSALGLLRKHWLPTLLLFDACLFLTPVGLSCLERGQFSLYVGLAYLLLLLALLTGRWRYALLCALFAFVKWTALPFVAVALAVALALSRDTREARQRLGFAAAFAATFALLTFCLPADALTFVEGLVRQEAEMVPTGNSLTKLLPRFAVKALPAALVIGGSFWRLSGPRPLAFQIPFFAAAGTVLATYPTSSFDYSTPYLVAFVPLLAHWADLPGIGPRLGRITVWGFAAFLLLASFARAAFGTSESIVIGSYAVAAALLACAPLLARRGQDGASA
jgi:hypothetical protein